MSEQQITRLTMFDQILVADPSFRPQWNSFMSEWADEPEPPLYLALGALAGHVIGRMEHGDTTGFDRIFAVVEQWHSNGDDYVKEAATIGFLESLQNRLGESDPLEPWLGPLTKEWWGRLNGYWNGETRAQRLDS